MSNESILSLSDDVKASMRAYASMAGFLLLGLMLLSGWITGLESSAPILGIESAILVLIGTILAFLHKRDLFAMFFMFAGFVYMIFSLGFIPAVYLAVGILDIFLAVAFCLTRNEQRIVVSVLLLIFGITGIISYLGQFDLVMITTAIGGIGCLYNAFAIGCERFKLPLRDILMADEENPSNDGSPVHFKVAGTSIVLAVLMLSSLSIIMMQLGLGSITWAQISTVFYATAIIEILASIIMLTAGRMRQTPFIFILCGAIGLILASNAGANVMMLTTIFEVILGILILLRSESRILLGLMLIFIGLQSVPTMIDPGLSALALVLEFIPLALGAYMILALNSDGRLKLI